MSNNDGDTKGRTSDEARKSISELIELVTQMKDNDQVASPKLLTQLQRALGVKHDFKVGDLVKWKAGLKDRTLPRQGEPAIVLEVLENEIVDTEQDTGSHYFHQKYDVRLGVLREGNLVDFLYQSSRFEPYDL